MKRYKIIKNMQISFKNLFITIFVSEIIQTPCVNSGAMTTLMNATYVPYMSTLTKYEAPYLCDYLSSIIDNFGRTLDVGGNDGTFLTELQKWTETMENPTVLERPIVCRIGKSKHPDISFIGGNMFEKIPPNYSTYIYKSVLHDHHPESKFKDLLTRHPKGRIVIIEVMAPPPRNDPYFSYMVPFSENIRKDIDYFTFLTRYGWTDIKIYPNLPLLYSLVTANKI